MHDDIKVERTGSGIGLVLIERPDRNNAVRAETLGGLYLLPRIVGLHRVSEMVLQGRPIKAEEAAEIGLVNFQAPEEDLRQRAIALAEELAELPPQSYRAVKAGLQRGMESTMDQEWATNVLAQSMLICTEDFGEGLAAVQEKRKGEFKGC